MTDRIRNICFTINNPGDPDFENLKALEPRCDYLIYGREHHDWAEEYGATPHLQGYLELHSQIRFNTFKKLLPRAHFEQRLGTAKQASDYCRKEDSDPYVYGEISSPGKRTDLDTLASQITSGLSKRKLAEVNPVAIIKFSRGIDELRSLTLKPRDSSTPKQVFVYWGTTGTGKTRTAVEDNPDAYIWGPENGKWFHGYDGEDTVILDEFRGQLPFGFLLRLLDRYPMKVETKGSMVEFVANKIIITSPYPPSNWYNGQEFDIFERREQLKRRFTECRMFGKDPSPI